MLKKTGAQSARLPERNSAKTEFAKESSCIYSNAVTPLKSAALQSSRLRSSQKLKIMLKRNLIIAVIFIAVLFAVRTAAQNATTQTFQNTAAITINDIGNASLYPSNINVSGVSSFTRMEVRLVGFSHTYPDDVDILLVGPQGQRAILMSDAGDNFQVANISFSFSQTATTPIPDSTTLFQGTQPFRPGNYQNSPGVFTDTFSAPGPGVLTDAPADLFVFNGTNPNGIWNLYVVDDATQDAGSIALGWSLTFTVPQIFTVTKTADTNDGVCDADCSLREALAAAQNGDLINFSSLFDTPQTINLLTALPDITRSITIQGKGANLLTVRRDFNAAMHFRIFRIFSAVAISGMTITGGNIGPAPSFGGGIYSEGLLMLTNVHLDGNAAGSGGGVYLSNADGFFTNCTFSNNRGGIQSGAISFSGNGRILRIVNNTISGNTSGIANVSFSGNSRLEIVNSTIVSNLSGGGIMTSALNSGSSATTTLRNTIVTGNTTSNLATETQSGGTATFQTLGFNLSDNYNGVFTPLGTDITSATPRLASLALYGGQTPTHALLHASPAINAGDASGATTDQRGVDRVTGASADIGAVEMRPVVVNNVNNTGSFSLRNVVAATNSASDLDDILFDNTVFNTPQTISLTSGELLISNPVNIIAPGANLVTISGNNASRVFQISPNITATLSGLTITGGNAGGDGGGIYNDGILTVTHSTISGNNSAFNGGGIGIGSGDITIIANSTISGNTAQAGGGAGGGIMNNGTLTVTNSTISGNTGQVGGGIQSQNAGMLNLTNSTIANNRSNAANSIGGINNVSGIANIRNSIIAGNVDNATKPDVGGTGFASNGFNLIGNRGTITFNQTGDQSGTGASLLNPQLGALQNNGGTTATHALLANSPALDKGNSSGATSDQRGSIRPIDLAGITNVSDGADIGAFEAQTAPIAATIRAPFDYDGDNKTDISIFRPTVGEWWYLKSSNGGNAALQFGTSSDKIVPADYTGDGKTDVAFWRPSTGEWYILRSEDSSFFAFPFGANGDVPQPADYDGDGRADAAVFRPSNATWFINKSTGGTDIIGFGAVGDVPVTADYDGDGHSDIGIYRPNGANGAEWWIRRSSNASVFALQFGLSTDKAVQGDYTGDGKADVAFWRPSDGNWFILRSEDFSFFAFPFGANGDIPVSGDYDGDGKFDAGVFRGSNTTWFINRSTAGTLIQQFGVAGDIPTPNAFVP